MTAAGAQPARRRFSEALGLAAGLAVSLLALVAVFAWSGWGRLGAALAAADYRWVVLGAILYLVSLVVRAACWRTLLSRSVPLGRVLATLTEGYLINNLLPWRLGEVGRALLLGRQPGMSPSRVLSSIVGERVLDVTMGLLLLAFLWPLLVGEVWAGRIAAVAGGALAVTLGIVVLTAARSDWIERLIKLLPGGAARWGRVWEGWRSGIRALTEPRTALVAFAWMALGWAIAGAEFWAVLRAFQPTAPAPWALASLAIIAFGGALPSAPASVGVFEFAAAAALAPFGVEPGTAVAYALVVHAVNAGLSTALGALALSGEGETLIGILRAARGWIRSAP